MKSIEIAMSLKLSPMEIVILQSLLPAGLIITNPVPATDNCGISLRADRPDEIIEKLPQIAAAMKKTIELHQEFIARAARERAAILGQRE